MNLHERHRRALEACQRCEEELARMLRTSAEHTRELQTLTRALTLLQARARALSAMLEREAMA